MTVLDQRQAKHRAQKWAWERANLERRRALKLRSLEKVAWRKELRYRLILARDLLEGAMHEGGCELLRESA